MSEFKIEKNIPLSDGANRYGRRYPWADMEVGDSFFIPCADTSEKRMRQINLIVSANGWAKRHGNGAQFTTRVADDGVRVWRIK